MNELIIGSCIQLSDNNPASSSSIHPPTCSQSTHQNHFTKKTCTYLKNYVQNEKQDRKPFASVGVVFQEEHPRHYGNEATVKLAQDLHQHVKLSLNITTRNVTHITT